MEKSSNDENNSKSNQSTQIKSQQSDEISFEEINELKQDKPTISEKLREEINDDNCLKINEPTISEVPNFENINNASNNKENI